MKELQIGDVTIKLPIIQGGMGIGVSMSSLASAVANEGGVGVISVAGLSIYQKGFASDFAKTNLDGLRQEIAKSRELSDGVIGVNIMVALTNYAELVTCAIEEGIDIIFSGAGLPLSLPQYLPKGSKTKLVPIVSSARAAKLLCSKWKEQFDHLPDAIVVEGPQAGGHLGFKKNQLEDPKFQIENLVVEVIEQVKPFEEEFNVKIPVIAAGGIYSGKDVKKILELGASGVQMGTRFVTTHECDASTAFKQTYIDSEKDDVFIIDSPVGMPGRAIKNDFIEKVLKGEKRPIKCPYHCLKTCNIETTPYCIVAALGSAMKGNLENGYAFAGSNAYKATEIISVKETFERIIQEYNEA